MSIKKIIITGVLTYGVYKILTGKVTLPPVVFAHEDNIGKETLVSKLTRRATKSLPYSVFCEITGCKYEVHSNVEQNLDAEMQEHLRTKH